MSAVEHRLELLAKHLGIRLDILVAKDRFDQLNGDVDEETWLLAARDPMTGRLPRTEEYFFEPDEAAS